MVLCLAINLQLIRDRFKTSSFLITSGLRTLEDYERLLRLKYRPSKTSDHFYGLPIKLDVRTYKFIKFGQYYNFSVGAADVVPKRVKAFDVFEYAIEETKAGRSFFGQIIYEINPDNGREWIHFSNDPQMFFQKNICDIIKKPKFLTSIDNGRTYNQIS